VDEPRILFVSVKDAFSVDQCVLKPYCCCTSKLFASICVMSLVYMSFSIILEKEVSKDMGL
jgi:hypothetical protein